MRLYRPRLRSRHPSHSYLRPKHKVLPLIPFKSVIRFGSLTEIKDTVSNGGNRIEVNTVDAISNSMNKLKMKECFTDNKVKTSKWWSIDPDALFWENNVQEVDKADEDELILDAESISYPVITKHILGSKGRGNQKHDNVESLLKWVDVHKDNLENYIIEKFYNYNREYRLHVTEEGCFYTCRKMLKNDTPKDKRWYRNSDNSVWILEENDSFDKPINWDNVVKHSVMALKAVGLDVGAVDLRIQSATDKDGEIRKDPKFIVVEINSAPALLTVGEQKYLEELPKILNRKYEEYKKEQNNEEE